MKSVLFGLVFVGVLSVGAVDASTAEAKKRPAHSFKQPKAPAVPELDPSGAASALALALAGGLVLSHRRKGLRAA